MFAKPFLASVIRGQGSIKNNDLLSSSQSELNLQVKNLAQHLSMLWRQTVDMPVWALWFLCTLLVLNFYTLVR